MSQLSMLGRGLPQIEIGKLFILSSNINVLGVNVIIKFTIILNIILDRFIWLIDETLTGYYHSGSEWNREYGNEKVALEPHH